MNGTSLYGRNITLKRNTTLCSTPGLFYLCSNLAYQCLEANWTQICYSIFLTQEISVYTEDQLLTTFRPTSWAKWAILLPILIGAWIATGIGTGIGGIVSSIGLYHRLSQELNEDMEQVADSVVTLQSQINSLAVVTLQNRWALDLLTSEKGGTCIFLGEECCYLLNQLRIVTTKVKKLKERIQLRQQESINQWKGCDLTDWVSWLPALVGPLLSKILVVSIDLCILNAVVLLKTLLLTKLQHVS